MSSSDNENGKKKKISQGRQCVAYGCRNTFYGSSGNKTGIHFFKFPQTNPRKSRWCNLIKRQDGKDGFFVTGNTFLCQSHFKDSDLKKNPISWRLQKDAEPSLNLYQSSFNTSTFQGNLQLTGDDFIAPQSEEFCIQLLKMLKRM